MISSAFFFEARATASGARDDLKPGTYQLQARHELRRRARRAREGPARNVVSVIVPEGRSRREIADIADRRPV